MSACHLIVAVAEVTREASVVSIISGSISVLVNSVDAILTKNLPVNSFKSFFTLFSILTCKSKVVSTTPLLSVAQLSAVDIRFLNLII